MYAARLAGGDTVAPALAPGRRAWLQVAGGAVRLEDLRLGAGDGPAIEDEPKLTLTAGADGAELLLFDLP